MRGTLNREGKRRHKCRNTEQDDHGEPGHPGTEPVTQVAHPSQTLYFCSSGGTVKSITRPKGVESWRSELESLFHDGVLWLVWERRWRCR